MTNWRSVGICCRVGGPDDLALRENRLASRASRCRVHDLIAAHAFDVTIDEHERSSSIMPGDEPAGVAAGLAGLSDGLVAVALAVPAAAELLGELSADEWLESVTTAAGFSSTGLLSAVGSTNVFRLYR